MSGRAEALAKIQGALLSTETHAAYEALDAAVVLLQQDEYDLKVLWHCYQTDNRPPMDLQQRLTDRFGV